MLTPKQIKERRERAKQAAKDRRLREKAVKLMRLARRDPVEMRRKAWEKKATRVHQTTYRARYAAMLEKNEKAKAAAAGAA